MSIGTKHRESKRRGGSDRMHRAAVTPHLRRDDAGARRVGHAEQDDERAVLAHALKLLVSAVQTTAPNVDHGER
eukprot:410622-Pleurochrysis_carterae.AAC.5